jgi:hypothetical protein
MTFTLKPEQERVLIEAINSGGMTVKELLRESRP